MIVETITHARIPLPKREGPPHGGVISRALPMKTTVFKTRLGIGSIRLDIISVLWLLLSTGCDCASVERLQVAAPARFDRYTRIRDRYLFGILLE
jgi:hypothetical protein